MHLWLALVGGALHPLALAPVAARPLALVAPLALLIALEQKPQRGALTGYGYGLGLFGVGASWVYVSMQRYGGIGIATSAALTAAFVAGLALLYALLGALYARGRAQFPAPQLTLFPLLWLGIEWLRGWLLTGFPWLYLGTASLDTPMAGWLPLVGTLGTGYLLVLLTALVWRIGTDLWPTAENTTSWRARMRAALVGLTAASALVVVGTIGNGLEWVTPRPHTQMEVALVQPSVPQSLKWDPLVADATVEQLQVDSEPLWGVADLIVWPEAAIPLFPVQIADVLETLQARALQSGTALITGIPTLAPAGDDDFIAHNSLITLGATPGRYDKQRLVPFGEYVPLERWLRGLIRFFDLPMSSFHRGAADQPPLRAAGLQVLPLICYEVAYAGLARRTPVDLLLTVSNDAWFGDSWGPHQHLEIARLRAIENGRPLVRGTNDGYTALIDHRGKVLQRSERFVRQTLRGKIQPTDGQTPWSRWGRWPLWLPLISVACLWLGHRRHHHRTA